MIVFKTEMENMPPACNFCNVKYGCKHVRQLNLDMSLEAFYRPHNCPLIKTPDPKPEPTLTQHEHDLVQIIKKVYPEYKYLIINKMFVNLFLAKNSNTDINDRTRIYYDCQMELFNTDKLPSLCTFTDNNAFCCEYNIDQILGRKIKD